MQKAFGRELPTSAEIRQRQKLERQTRQQVASNKDAVVDALHQASPESSVLPLNPIDDSCANRGFNAFGGDCRRSANASTTFTISAEKEIRWDRILM